MGHRGRDPEFFQYVEGNVADRILERTRHALVEMDAAANPYLHWILTGTHGEALPHALRPESFEAIRSALSRPGAFEVINAPLEAFLATSGTTFDAFNLSDIFEYMSESSMNSILQEIVCHSNSGARLAYWNMLVPRNRPQAMADVLFPLEKEAARLFFEDKAWFYSRFIVEEVLA